MTAVLPNNFSAIFSQAPMFHPKYAYKPMEQTCLGQVHLYTLKMLLVSQHIFMFLLKYQDINFLLAPCSHYLAPVTSAAFLPESLVSRITKLIVPN